ncbi:phBC6A51 family helix-turn-helix protein [Lactobacillus helveticus]|nr:phBC6A51 family helix-turn-helix protein [Lactobacillus helveticus]
MKNNMSEKGAFQKLNKKRQKAVEMIFEHRFTNVEIGAEVGVDEKTIRRWKKDPEFIRGLHDYSLNKLNSALPLAVQQSYELLENPKTSAMVKFQLIQMLFKYANLLSDNSTPELDKAKIRKANADARVAEARANVAERLGSEGDDKLDELMDKLISASEKPKDQT